MPVTDYICNICQRQILINYLEGPGEMLTSCAASHKIKVTTNDEGHITKIEEVKDEPEVRRSMRGSHRNVDFLIPSPLPNRPPALASKLISSLLHPDLSEVILGDMAESFKDICEDRNIIVARRWYWRQTISTLWPEFKKWLLKIAG